MRRHRSGFLFRVLCLETVLVELLCLSTQVASADSFDWRNVNAVNWNTSVKSQFGGTCWDFASVGSFESRYMLTRNDASFVPDLSEQQLCWETNPDLGGTGGGGGSGAMSYCCTHGVVSETECPVEANSAYWDAPGPGDPWPLASGWQNRCWKSTADLTPFVTSTTAGIKAALKLQGPLLTGILSYNDMYQTVADLETNYRKPMPGVDHAVVIMGYQDDANVPSGGYWIIENSWGTGCGDNGYWFVPYGDVENHMSTQAYSGSVYYTGPMYHTGPWDATGVDYTGTAATNTWKGTTNAVWDTTAGTSGNWPNNSSGGTFTWVNQELQAVFDSTGSNKAITISGPVIAHGLTISTSGYSFAASGTASSLTVTAGGITSTNSVTFSTPIYIGGPQSWSIASGNSMTVSGALHTVISDLTFSGAGTTTISGAIDGGGVLNSLGAAPGGLIQAGSGPVYLTGTTNYSGNITAQSGAGTLYIAPPGAGSTTWNGAFFGGGAINFNCSALTLGGGASNFTGSFAFQKACSLTFVPAAGITGTFGCVLNNNGSVTQNGPGVTVLNGRDTYTGSTTISNGLLQANIGTGIPSGSFLKLDGGVLQSNGTSTVSFTRSLGTSGSTFQWTNNGGGFSAGAAAMNVNVGNGASLTWGTTPGTNVMGTLKLSSSAAAAVTTFQNKVALNGATRTIFVDDNPNSTNDYAVMSGVISGSAGIIKTGLGQLNLTATDTYTGSTTISGGVLQANLGAGLPSSSYLVLDGGVLQNNSTSFTRRLGTTQNGSYFEWTANGGGFSPSGSALTVNIGGSGATLAWGATPGTNIMGTLKLGSLTATANVTFQNGLNLGGGAQTIEADGNYSTYLSGAIVGTGSLIKTGTSTLYVQGSSGNTYTGSTTILGGYMDLNKSSGYAIPGDLILGGSTSFMVSVTGSNQISPNAKFSWIGTGGWQEVKLFGHSQTVTGLSDNTSMGVVENTWGESGYAPVTLTINNSIDCSFNGTLRDTCTGSTGALNLIKTGTGTQTLSNGNISYTGGTTISQGKLVLQDLTSTAFCALGITNNATLGLSAVHQDFSFSGVISGSGGLTVSGGDTVTLSGSSGNTYTGATSISDGRFKLAKSSGYAIPGDFTLVDDPAFAIVQNPNQFPTTAKVTFSGSGNPHLEVYGNTVTVGAINGSGGGEIENTEGEGGVASGTIVVNNSTNCSYSGTIRDNAGGSGILR